MSACVVHALPHQIIEPVAVGGSDGHGAEKANQDTEGREEVMLGFHVPGDSPAKWGSYSDHEACL